MAITNVKTVEKYHAIIAPHLDSLRERRHGLEGQRPVTESECTDLLDRLWRQNSEEEAGDGQQAGFAAIETVFREKFYELLASIDINDGAFTQVWNLLDTVAILSDRELCESGLIIWLVEELLDSQTIESCRKVFDYLESRRERITSKHFKQKQLIVLRCCNELLRRLSRAEDIVFCGRVFIFLFQSFPLGDKSSVNLRGEYHVENVTSFDPSPIKSQDAIKPMDLDPKTENELSNAGTPASSLPDEVNGSKVPKNVPTETTTDGGEPAVDLDALYPSFWALQAYFSAPTRLFEKAHLSSFKEGVAATMACFETMTINTSSSALQDDSRRGTKRKRSDINAEVSSTFNPKYLTNRDLFDLELHDISFRRHVLVQMLILLDFLLSLTAAAKAKLADLTNKSVLYGYVLSEEDTAWAVSTRAAIVSYLQQGTGNEGKFYYRMVDMVLSRDKNWARWKAENCPPIDRPSVDVQQFIHAQQRLGQRARKGPLPPPPGAHDLDFLSKSAPMESLKDPSRYAVPTMEHFYKGIQNDELDAEMGTEEETQAAQEAKERKIWRALRASKNRFTLCEKIHDGKNLEALLGKTGSEEHTIPSDEIASKAADE